MTFVALAYVEVIQEDRVWLCYSEQERWHRQYICSGFVRAASPPAHRPVTSNFVKCFGSEAETVR